MTIFPVVERELRVLARSRRLYWGRFISAQVALALVAWFWFTFSSAAGANAARQIFGGLAFLSFGYCLLVGSFLTADAISEEKREGTLGLLFLTDLKGYDVAFGKLAANSLQALYNLLAIFPVMSVPLLLGGLAGAEVFRMTLILLDALVFSLTVGLLISTLSRHERKAQAAAFAVVLAVTGGIPALVTFLNYQFHWSELRVFLAVSPGYAFAYAFEQSFAANPAAYWRSLAVVHILSWVAFLTAAVLIRRVWQDQPGEPGRGGFWAAFRRWKHGSSGVRRQYRATLLQNNAYFWLVARDRLKPYYVLWFLGICGLFWLFLWSYNRRDMVEQEAFFVTAFLLHTALKIWVTSEAGRQFFDDRKSSALELTLSTPLPVREILEGQCLALFRQFGPAIGLVLIFDVVGMIVAARVRLGSDAEWLLTWAASMVIFLVDVATLATLGMWLGLTAKRYSRAMARGLFFVLGLPWIIFFGLISYMAVARLTSLNSLSFVIGMYFVISLVTDLVLYLNASGNLTRLFREIATRRFDSPDSAR